MTTAPVGAWEKKDEFEVSVVEVVRIRPNDLLVFQELYDVVADLLEPLHHHQVPRSFHDH